ncbi:MAG: hypothetical protein AB7E70_12695 [Hyphomicrobiaceae bacterium]
MRDPRIGEVLAVGATIPLEPTTSEPAAAEFDARGIGWKTPKILLGTIAERFAGSNPTSP